MSDTINVRCPCCGEMINEIAYISGKQVIRCKKCYKKIVVIIKPDGSLYVRESWSS